MREGHREIKLTRYNKVNSPFLQRNEASSVMRVDPDEVIASVIWSDVA